MLVRELVKFITANDPDPPNMMLLSDQSDWGRDQRPPRIGGFVPDVYAYSGSKCAIGEAKTAEDLQTPRTKNQILAFLDHLRFQKEPRFVIAVPLFAQRAAIGLVRRCALLLRPLDVRLTCISPSFTYDFTVAEGGHDD